MSDELSALNMATDYEEVVACSDAARWQLEKQGPLVVLATMASAKFPTERFQAYLAWARYPDDAPSLKFRDPASGGLDLPTAWPVVRGFRPASLDACVNYCAEGFGLHPEWRNDPQYRWTCSGNVLLKVLRILQDELDEHCSGRHGK